jgi:hypothetical protein
MAAATFNRSIHSFNIHPLVAILAEFMRSFLIAVDISIAYVLGVAISAFINHHHIILGMMAYGAGICFLVLTMGKISRFPCLLGLQDHIPRTNAYLHTKSTSDDKE